MRGEQRQVDAHELLLEVDRIRRHDHALGMRTGPMNGGNEVGEGFAGAGSGLDEQDAAPSKRLGHALGHADLLVAVLVAGETARNRAVRPELGGDDLRIERCAAQTKP